MFCLGTPSVESTHLVKVAQDCLFIGINLVKPGVHLGDIGYAIQQHAEKNNYSIVREYCGHGIGRIFHEEPEILHYGVPGWAAINSWHDFYY